MSLLLSPLRVGDLNLPNRVFMAPLTRARSGPTRVPNALNVEYYRQRAGAGLILTEATAVTPEGVGYADTPGIWSTQQVEGWKAVTAAVHAAAGAHLPAAVACGAHLGSAVSGWRIAGRTERHRAQGPCEPGASGNALRRAARPGAQ